MYVTHVADIAQYALSVSRLQRVTSHVIHFSVDLLTDNYIALYYITVVVFCLTNNRQCVVL